MPYVIGTDEAGYGPHLGPLVVSATVWEVDDGVETAALYKQLRRVVTHCVDRATKKRIVWADSKAVYKGGVGMDHLERGVLAALALLGRLPGEWAQLWQELDSRCHAPDGEAGQLPTTFGDRMGHFGGLPWHLGFSAALPMWMNGRWSKSGSGLAELADCLRAGLAASGVRLAGMLCRAVFPGEFNAMVAGGNKADALSRITLGLAADALAILPSGEVQVFCDKHGGRDYYLPILQTQFPDDWIQVLDESGSVSRYRFDDGQHRVEIGFYVGGEKFLPVALASMTAKYLRETAMRPFNEFWCNRVPGLKPTAGYPTDSWRFKREIADVQRELGIEDGILWRCR